MTIPQNVNTWLTNWLSKERLSTVFATKRLAGDGSTRTFYRVSISDRSWILLSDPQWTMSQDYPAHQKFLKQAGLPVPEFYGWDAGIGCLLMEDLGDELLQFHLLSEPQTKMAWLEKMAILLADLHGRTFPVPETLPVAQRSFDKEKYFQEFQFTLTHLAVGLLKQGAASQENLKILEAFCTELGEMRPLVFSHRDFHTRNVLLHKNSLFMIDFQDARLGGPHYDLASLLYDPYVPLSRAERVKLQKTYCDQLAKYPVSKKVNWDRFETDLRMVAYQRTIKAAGSYASFYTRFGKDTHLSYLSPALHSALELRRELPKLSPDIDSILPIEKWIGLSKSLKVK